MSENIWKREKKKKEGEGIPGLVMNIGLEPKSTAMEGLARHKILDILSNS